ncbi:MAG: M42 family metallopeptidase [Ruminococcaceae bacterium]|nr:M42 family metallopeptidase [Oscillospiraceae bacterium]
MDMTELTGQLCMMRGVSGHEHRISKDIAALFAPLCDTVEIDPLGSVIACRKGTGDGGTVMMEAHMDEIGLMVKEIDENGFLYLTNIGGIDARILPANEVVVHGKTDLPGVVGAKPPHILGAEERKAALPLDKLYVDVGLSADKVREQISVGDSITFESTPLCLAGGRLSVKSQDDRSSVGVLLSVLEQLKHVSLPFDLYAVAAVQEEVGLRGSGCAAYRIQPDFAIAIDVCHGDTPDASENTFPLGSGAVVTKGPNIHPVLVQALTKVLDEHHIPYLIDIDGGDTGTDAWAIQIAGNGIPTLLFSLPLRYMHTPIETLQISDLNATAQGICRFLQSIERVGDVLC